MSPAIRAFIFDLDGVLVDTSELHYRAWKRLADEESLPFGRRRNEALRGVSRRESLLLILQDRIVSEEKMEEMMERKNRYYLEMVEGLTPADMLPGACAILDEIRAAGLKSAVGSASKNARRVVELLGIGALLDALADGWSVSQPKPAPDLFLRAAGMLGCAPSECVVVEDAAAGIEAARAGGFCSIGLGPRRRVGKADLVLPSLKGARLQPILNALG